MMSGRLPGKRAGSGRYSSPDTLRRSKLLTVISSGLMFCSGSRPPVSLNVQRVSFRAVRVDRICVARRRRARHREADFTPGRDFETGDDAVRHLRRLARTARRKIEQSQPRDAILVDDISDEAAVRVDLEILDAPVGFGIEPPRRTGPRIDLGDIAMLRRNVGNRNDAAAGRVARGAERHDLRASPAPASAASSPACRARRGCSARPRYS